MKDDQFYNIQENKVEQTIVYQFTQEVNTETGFSLGWGGVPKLCSILHFVGWTHSLLNKKLQSQTMNALSDEIHP